MSKERLERLGKLPVVIPVLQEAQELVEESIDPNYDTDDEMEAEAQFGFQELEQQYQQYVPPLAITREELNLLLEATAEPDN